MKKFFAIAAVAAMLIACGEPEENKPQGGNNNGGNTEQPGGNENQEPEYVAPITIDGNFADWDALDASKVASATLPSGTVKFQAFKAIKVYCDANYLFVYGKLDPALITTGKSNLHLYLNLDGDETTGGGADAFGEPYCCDFMTETCIWNEGAVQNYDPALFPWPSYETGNSGWLWSCLDEGVTPDGTNNWGALITEGSGIGSSAGANGEFEIAILKLLINDGEWADEFSMGVDISDTWSDAGFLPCAEVTEENTGGAAGLLTVTTVK